MHLISNAAFYDSITTAHLHQLRDLVTHTPSLHTLKYVQNIKTAHGYNNIRDLFSCLAHI